MLEQRIEEKLYELSSIAYKKGEVPVSAIVIHNSKIIAKGYNLKEKNNDVTAHAEVLAIRKASRRLKRWNLSDCDLYVSLKPCKMCEEVIKQSRIRNVYYLLERLEYKHDYDKTNFIKSTAVSGEDSYQQLLSDFFQNIR